jgi:transcriptional regulator with GAF, ATPase, and Fis domain
MKRDKYPKVHIIDTEICPRKGCGSDNVRRHHTERICEECQMFWYIPTPKPMRKFPREYVMVNGVRVCKWGNGRKARAVKDCKEMELPAIQRALDECLGSRMQAAKILGISIRTFRNKQAKYGMDKGEWKCKGGIE